MSIDPIQPVILTPEQVLQQTINDISNFNRAILLSCVSFAQQSFARIWNDNNYNPQQILTGFGQNAAVLFSAYQGLCQLIMGIDNTFVLPAPQYNFTINADGTVTVGTLIAPQGVTAISGSQQVSLSWSSNQAATSYNIMRATASGGLYTQIGSSTTPNYVDTGLVAGTQYFYVVQGVGFNGNGDNSTEVNGTAQ